MPWIGLGPTTRRLGAPRPGVSVVIREVEGLSDTAFGDRAARPE